MSYHIEIKEERRKPIETPLGIDTSRMAWDVDGVLYGMSDADLSGKDWSDPQFLGVFEWDCKSPYVVVHKGEYVPRFFGWPQITEKDYVPPAADL